VETVEGAHEVVRSGGGERWRLLSAGAEQVKKRRARPVLFRNTARSVMKRAWPEKAEEMTDRTILGQV